MLEVLAGIADSLRSTYFDWAQDKLLLRTGFEFPSIKQTCFYCLSFGVSAPMGTQDRLGVESSLSSSLSLSFYLGRLPEGFGIEVLAGIVDSLRSTYFDFAQHKLLLRTG